MKKKLFSITVIVSMLLLNNSYVYADMDFSGMNDFSNTAMDFSMDMIMDQGLMSMQGADDMIVQAEETNFMNHELDNTLSFFFDNLDQYQEDVFFVEEINIQDAFSEGNWSDSFNEHFNVDSGLLFPEIEFTEEIQGNSPQGVDSSDITYDDSMPNASTNEDGELSESNNLLDHSDIVNQIENNTMPEELPTLPNEDIIDTPNDEVNKEETPSIENDIEVPTTSNDISIIEE